MLRSLKSKKTDNTFITERYQTEDRFVPTNVKPANYVIEATFVGYRTITQDIFVGSLSGFPDRSTLIMEEDVKLLNSYGYGKAKTRLTPKWTKTFSVDDNISQSGGIRFTNHTKPAGRDRSGQAL
jgi:hypothetical protein